MKSAYWHDVAPRSCSLWTAPPHSGWSPLRCVFQLGGQLPQFVGELVPAQSEVTALRVKSVEERAAIEDRQWPHSSQPMSADTAPSLSFESPLTWRNRPTNGCVPATAVGEQARSSRGQQVMDW
jgi:hypothetical protein